MSNETTNSTASTTADSENELGDLLVKLRQHIDRLESNTTPESHALQQKTLDIRAELEDLERRSVAALRGEKPPGVKTPILTWIDKLRTGVQAATLAMVGVEHVGTQRRLAVLGVVTEAERADELIALIDIRRRAERLIVQALPEERRAQGAWAFAAEDAISVSRSLENGSDLRELQSKTHQAIANKLADLRDRTDDGAQRLFNY